MAELCSPLLARLSPPLINTFFCWFLNFVAPVCYATLRYQSFRTLLTLFWIWKTNFWMELTFFLIFSNPIFMFSLRQASVSLRQRTKRPRFMQKNYFVFTVFFGNCVRLVSFCCSQRYTIQLSFRKYSFDSKKIFFNTKTNQIQ